MPSRNTSSALPEFNSPPPNFLVGVDLPTQPKQERSRKRRDAFLHAAQALFMQQGFEATSIEAIAQAADSAVGGFYLYFRSKLQLLLVLMDQFVSAVAAFQIELKPSMTTRAALQQLVASALYLDTHHRGAYRAWREALVLTPQLVPLNQAFERWAHERLIGAFTAMQMLPGARADVDIQTTALLINNLFLELIAHPELETPEQIAPALTDLIYHALFLD